VAADAYRTVPSANDDVSAEESSDARTNTLGSSLQKFCPKLDSVKELDHGKGKYQAYLGPLVHGDKYRVRWTKVISNNPLRIDSSQIRSREFRKAPQGYKNFNINPWYNTTVLIWLEVDTLDGPGSVWANPLACNLDMAGNGFVLFNTGGGGGSGTLTGSVIDGNISSFPVACRPQVLTIVEQNPARCVYDSVLLRAVYSGGKGIGSYLWSNGDTTKRTVAGQGQTLTVTITDAAGCSITDSITAATFDNTAVPGNWTLTKGGPTIYNGSFTAPTLPAGSTLIGYRMAYRLRNTLTWTNTPLSQNTTISVDLSGSGLPSGNYEFVAFTRYNNGAGAVNSGFTCRILKGYNGSGAKSGDNAANGSDVGVVSIYPNPTKDVLYVASPAGAKISLLDASGKTIAVQTSGTAEVQFDMSALAQGVYMLLIQTEDEFLTERIVKN